MNNRTNTIRFWILLAVLLLGGGIINIWQRAGEAHVSRRALRDFPSQLGGWRQVGEDVRFDDETEKVLSADDYLSRNFVSDGRTASFYVGYYATQRNGATYHSPLNCLPSRGPTPCLCSQLAPDLLATAGGSVNFSWGKPAIKYFLPVTRWCGPAPTEVETRFLTGNFAKATFMRLCSLPKIDR